jgi:Methyltransferase domain
MLSLADVPEAAAEAAKFGVPPEIHAEDLIYQFHLGVQAEPNSDTARAHVTEYYFFDGDRSARQLDALVRKFYPQPVSRRIALLEFASGYGCVSRHLRKMHDRYDVVACDIHTQAIEFLRERLGVNAVPSRHRPADFALDRIFDIVFALSFFSHMPHRTFGGWVAALFSRLSENGLLVFTTHGRTGYSHVGNPTLHPEGYWFAPFSEQRDISTEEYGCMVTTPSYVMECIARCPGAALIFFQESYWWGTQDLYIVRKVATDFSPERKAISSRGAEPCERSRLEELAQEGRRTKKELEVLRAVIHNIHLSRSWRLTALLRTIGALFRHR